ncbi:MAG: ferric reductase-like transmembrane domain-containing protein [Microscillaceae bacterium]|nr:ferric reductase-like transmembrane domain-containing protein [Microscillaceae bacterium]
MSVGYKPVLWNRQKRMYDFVILGAILVYCVIFIGLNVVYHPEIAPSTLIIRTTATLAVLMLHIILCIGPLARIDRRFLPLLYNRRHLGVSMFLVAAFHGIFSLFWFHGSGNVNPLFSLFTSNLQYHSFVDFPFQTLGFVALLILFMMAASSHDFWLKNLDPKVWKTLHMLVYWAYALVIMHVMLGAYQMEQSPVLSSMLGVGLMVIITLHLVAGFKEGRKDHQRHQFIENGFVKVAALDEIPENRAKIVHIGKESIAVFKYDHKLSAISNICKHQNGPLGEGKIVDGCITCPWHGYQYLPHNGSSPPPFTEKVATYQVLLIDQVVYVDPKPFPEGTAVEPVMIYG